MERTPTIHRIGSPTVALLVLVVACGGPERPPDSSSATKPIFRDVTAGVGLELVVDRAAGGDYFMPDSMAAGCALLDFDGDGALDVYLIQGRQADGEFRGEHGANRLFRQQESGRFVELPNAAGAADPGFGMGVAVGDVDNDGDPDLYVTNYGADALYRNDAGQFTDVTRAAGLGDTRWGASAAFFDYDRDGFLDLFVTHYLDYPAQMRVRDSAGRPEYPGPDCCPGVPDILYRNNGDGTFADVSVAAGISDTPGKGLGVAVLDLNGDRWLDVYVANDGETNRAWINGQSGSFVDAAETSGVGLNIYGGAEASMGVAVGDFNGDLQTDIFLTHLFQETNTLYLGEKDGLFRDATMGSGLGRTSVDFTGFGTAALDADLDGDLDLLVVNGRVLRSVSRPGSVAGDHWSRYAEENQLYWNDGQGRFRLASEECGTLCSRVEVSRGLCVGDLDDDGMPELLLTDGRGTARVYRGDRPGGRHWIGIRALDARGPRDAPGASVYVRADGRTQLRLVAPAAGYLSSHDARAHFGLGDARQVEEIRIVWPDGDEERFGPREIDRYHTLVRGEGD